MSEPALLNKIILLYLLSRSESPLSNAHICEFFVESRYCDYFTARNTISTLAADKMINPVSTNNMTRYSLTPFGKESLLPMMDQIEEGIIADVNKFLSSRDISLKNNRDLYSDYDKSTYGGYLIHLKAAEDGRPIMDISLSVASEIQAKTICTNWMRDYESVYAALIGTFLS